MMFLAIDAKANVLVLYTITDYLETTVPIRIALTTKYYHYYLYQNSHHMFNQMDMLYLFLISLIRR
jgi:hypothetical protein